MFGNPSYASKPPHARAAESALETLVDSLLAGERERLHGELPDVLRGTRAAWDRSAEMVGGRLRTREGGAAPSSPLTPGESRLTAGSEANRHSPSLAQSIPGTPALPSQVVRGGRS